MIEKLKEIKARYDLLSQEIAKPDTMADMDNWRKLVKEHASLEEVAQEYDAYVAMEREQEDLRSMLEDPEMRDLAEEELRTLTGKLSEAEERIRFLLLPKDENDDKNVVMEIRAGTGLSLIHISRRCVFCQPPRPRKAGRRRMGWNTGPSSESCWASINKKGAFSRRKRSFLLSNFFYGVV